MRAAAYDAVMLDRTFTVQRSTTISATPEEVYAQIADFRNWPHWSPWEDLDAQMVRTYSGADSGEGAEYAWDGDKKAGAGRMEICEAHPPHKIGIDLDFERPFPASNTIVFTIAPEDAVTRVTWSMSGPLTLPMRLFSLVRPMDKMVGPDFERGLARLKAHLEQAD